MAKLPLTFACWNYDRTRGLLEGRIPVDGISLNYLDLPVEETFFRMLRHHEFDVAEMSLSSYTVSLFKDNPPFIAIPVFPSRMFRHSYIFVNANSGIREPKDLIRKRIGTPEYQMTATVWIRGMLSDEYGVKVTECQFLTGGEEEPGRPEKLKLDLPPEIQVQAIPADKTLSRMLETGEIDALYTARTPSTYNGGSGAVRRLFPNFQDVERQYFRKTKIFPIMHTVVIRRDIYQRHPWVAQSLCKAFVQAQKEIYADLHQTGAVKFMLPWLMRHVEETEEVMGTDFWPYGFQANCPVLDTFLRYHHEQGLSKRQLKPNELFAPETFEAFKI
jgi:4,5-dihydroxyphthalate decarboxylase